MKSKSISILSLFSFFLILMGSINQSFAAEGDTYSFTWLDPDKEVYVLQNRKFRKRNRAHISLGAGLTASGAFVDSTNFQGRLGYFFREEWGFEAIYSINNGEENSTATSVRNNGRTGSIPFRRIVDSYMGGMVLWSPFYAKINTFNKIIYLDWIIGLGMAQLEESNNKLEFTVTNNNTITTENHTGLMWDVGMKFYLDESFDARIDLTTIHYKANQPNANGEEKSTYYSNWDVTFSVGYNF
jgi:outer membrane beta-barrel protein